MLLNQEMCNGVCIQRGCEYICVYKPTMPSMGGRPSGRSGGGSLRTNWRITTARRQRDSGRQQSWIRDTHQTDAQPRCKMSGFVFVFSRDFRDTGTKPKSGSTSGHTCVPKHYEKNIKMHLFCFACSFRWNPSEEREGESINWNRRSRKHFGSIEGKIQYLGLISI